MRLIDADKLCTDVFNGSYYDNRDEDIFLDMIDKQETVDAAPVVHGLWAEIRKEPPKPQTYIIACNKDCEGSFAAYYDGDKIIYIAGTKISDIATHWMPLPDPPKE